MSGLYATRVYNVYGNGSWKGEKVTTPRKLRETSQVRVFCFSPAPVFSGGSDEATSHFFPFLFYFFSLLWSGYRFFFISPPSTFLHETSLSFLIEVLLRLVPKKKKGIKDVADWLSRTELDGCLGRGGRCYNTCLGERDWQREGDAIPDLPSLSWGPSCLRLLPRGTLPRQGEYAHS